MLKFLHHLFNPHCPECSLEREESKVCQSCETLKMELSLVREQNQQLLDTILNPKKEEIVEVKQVEYQPISKPHIPWTVRKQHLEAESRQQARILRERKEEMDNANKTNKPSVPVLGIETKTIEELEKDLGVVDATG